MDNFLPLAVPHFAAEKRKNGLENKILLTFEAMFTQNSLLPLTLHLQLGQNL